MDDYIWQTDNIFGEDFEDKTSLTTSRQLSEPKVYTKKEAKRIMINGLKKQALNELIPELPPPDMDMYIISNGDGAEIKHGINPKAFDFGTFLSVIVDMLGAGCIAYISTWTLNRNHALNMIEMLDSGALQRLTILTDPYFQSREPAVAALLIEDIQRHGEPNRYLAFKNHCKIIALSDAKGENFCTITGSANLSSQPRCEQYVLTTSPDVYHFFIHDFFESMI